MADAITFQHYEVLVRDDGTPWELGRGAMGVTYKALDTNLRVPVALKVIHPSQLNSALVAQRFVREARAAARLRHPHIAAVYHLGQEGENWFYAMEFVAGDTAEGLVKRSGPLAEPIVITLGVQAARALQAAAALGLVHRDLKPSNLMLTREGDEWQLKLIDFGLARTFAGHEPDEDLAAVTHSGFVGTPYYASPEQLEQKELDVRSDIYSLGVTLWFLLTGRVPYAGSFVSVLAQHLHKPPPSEQLDACASPALRGLLERMLAKDPSARPQSPLDLRRALEQCLGSTPRGSAVQPAPAPVLPDSGPASEAALETLAMPSAAAPPASGPADEPQFDGAETVADLGFGQLCRARDRTLGTPFALLRLSPLASLDDATVAALRAAIDRARRVVHPQVWRVHRLQAGAEAAHIVLDWSEGYSWCDLLRRHRKLEPGEALPLLALAAAGIDAILAAGIDQPDVSLTGLWCEAPSPGVRPVGVKVSPLGLLRTLALGATWGGEGTLAGADAPGLESGPRGALRSLARVAYETLGGTLTVPGFPPLPALSESANQVLRTTLSDPGAFPSASAFVAQLRRAEAEPAPSASYRTAPTTPPPPATQTPAQPELVAAPTASAPEPRPRRRGLALAVSLAVLAASAWFIFHPRETTPRARTAEPPTPAPATPGKTVAGPPDPQPLPTTPAPVAIVRPPPATPLPIPPAPTREALARTLQKQAGAQRERGQWPDAAQTLLTMRETYPEYASGADADLELLFRDIRWRYTRYRDQPPDLSRAEVEALRPAIEKAESLGIVGARMLLGEHLSTRADWRRAIAHYEKARDRAPKATTRIGLLYARFSTQPEELARAWEYFQAAHQAGDLDGKIAAAECLLYGTFGDTGGGKFVPGLEADAQKGAQLLREIIGTRPTRRVPAELADARLTETYLTEPNRSKLVLGSFYLDWERDPAKQQDWYRLEKKQIDHPREMRRLLEEAREDWTDAYSQLGNAAREGLGGKPDPAAARAYFQEGARRNNLQATFNYAVLLTQSAPPGTIPAEARQLFQTAAERGHPLALDFCTKNKIPVAPKAPPPQ